MVLAFRAKTESFDFPICASLRASTENLLNTTQNTQLGKGRQGMENFSPKGIFSFLGGRVLQGWVVEAAGEEEGCEGDSNTGKAF